MKIYKFVFTGIIITFLSVGYVHQRVEILKTGYNLQENRKHLSCLVDQNTKLMYNLSKLESPRNLLTLLDGDQIEFANHRVIQRDRYRLAKVVSAESAGRTNGLIKFLDIFTVNAEAKTRE